MCESKFDEWRNVQLGDERWRTDWSGKELLAGILQYFAAVKGWPEGATNTRVAIEWDKMNSAKRRQKMREIEWEMQRDFVESLFKHLDTLNGEGIAAEWGAIRRILSSAK